MHFIIADDHPLFRGALRQVLSGQSENVEIVEVGDFDAVRKLVAERDDIDLLLLDLTMPGGAGLSGLVALKALQPALPVVIMRWNWAHRASFPNRPAWKPSARRFVPCWQAISGRRKESISITRKTRKSKG
jgi:DNA-binding LytR/AlgR family response regulator